jgi:hypothetical protein
MTTRFIAIANDGSAEWQIPLSTTRRSAAWREAVRRLTAETILAYGENLEGTVALDLRVERTRDGDPVREGRITVDPPAPPCRYKRHRWSAYRGPIGSGAGVAFVERCRHCKLEQVYDSGASDHCGRPLAVTRYRQRIEG